MRHFTISVQTANPYEADDGHGEAPTITVTADFDLLQGDEYDDAANVKLSAAGIDEDDLRALIPTHKLVELALAEISRDKSQAARAVPGMADMLAVTQRGGIVTDQGAFETAARHALAALGDARSVFIAAQWAQTEDLRLDQHYQARIEAAAK